MLKKFVHKKIDEWYIKWQRVVQRMTKNDDECYKEWRRTKSNTVSDNEWQIDDDDGDDDDDDDELFLWFG